MSGYWTKVFDRAVFHMNTKTISGDEAYWLARRDVNKEILGDTLFEMDEVPSREKNFQKRVSGQVPN